LCNSPCVSLPDRAFLSPVEELKILNLAPSDEKASSSRLRDAALIDQELPGVGIHENGYCEIAGRAWFDRMMQMTVDGLAQLEASGDARSSSDPMMRALLLIAMDLGVVFLRPLVEERFGVSLTDPALSERWIRTELELLSLGVLTTKEA
jgi:hypothetical protein